VLASGQDQPFPIVVFLPGLAEDTSFVRDGITDIGHPPGGPHPFHGNSSFFGCFWIVAAQMPEANHLIVNIFYRSALTS
jgi:hypothetical protein